MLEGHSCLNMYNMLDSASPVYMSEQAFQSVKVVMRLSLIGDIGDQPMVFCPVSSKTPFFVLRFLSASLVSRHLSQQ